jgi:hypothetical protein
MALRRAQTDLIGYAYEPREFGRVCGPVWAERAPKQEVAQVADRGEIPEHVRDLTFDTAMRRRVDEFEEDEPAAFWHGFVEGVRAYVVGRI